MNQLILTPLEGLPLIQQGDGLADLISAALGRQNVELHKGDLVVVAQKIVSKAEGRRARLADVNVSERAKEVAATTQKDPRIVQLILDESTVVLRARPNLLIVEHKLGFICANAGIDHSNVEDGDELALLLPVNP
ncbi:MAG: coenzyme F420-0:L-glutamate ligase, partial [Anaerolineales bacterium]